MRVLVIGEAPSRWMDANGITEALPLAGRELAALAAVDWPTGWHEKFEPINVLDEWPGKQGKGDKFPMDLAQPAAGSIFNQKVRPERRRVVLLGLRVARAFGLVEVPWFEWIGRDGWTMAVAPHPSHISTWWNQRTNVEAARAFWRECAQGVRQDVHG